MHDKRSENKLNDDDGYLSRLQNVDKYQKLSKFSPQPDAENFRKYPFLGCLPHANGFCNKTSTQTKTKDP